MITVTLTNVTTVFVVRGLKMEYTIWPKGSKWFWQAAGNGNLTDSKETAEAEARRWLRDGQ